METEVTVWKKSAIFSKLPQVLVVLNVNDQLSKFPVLEV